MHKKHAKDGLVAISLSLDSPDDRAASLSFLKKQQATFANYLLDEETEAWQEQWKVTNIPVICVYQNGQKVVQFDYDDPDKEFTYDDVEKAVVKLLPK